MPQLQRMNDPRIADVDFVGGFWGDKFRIYRENTISNGWKYIGLWPLRSLQLANGILIEGGAGNTWDEANIGKHLEAAALSLAQKRDSAVEAKIDNYITLFLGAQQSDGYLHAHMTNENKPHWSLELLGGSHEGYVRGHLTDAAIAYYETTGKREFLDAMIQAADEACKRFLTPGTVPAFCGHPGYKMSLADLYRTTGETRYLDLAVNWVELRGKGHKQFSETYMAPYAQDNLPVRDQRTMDGHAVRAVYFACGVADLALELGSMDYRLAANRLWDSATLRRMYITGSIGARAEHESFGEDYELPSSGYAESCAANGLLDFAHRMFKLERRAECGDIMERVIYNALLHSISLDGTATYYNNHLSDKDTPRYNRWVCCPPCISKTLFRMARYAYGYSDQEAWINLYVAGTALLKPTAGDLKLSVDTQYPHDGMVSITVEKAPGTPVPVNLRIPGWCETHVLTVNGQKIPTDRNSRTTEGYVRLDRTWMKGDTIKLVMDMPVLRMEAHPNVADCVGKVAIQRGPVVYGLEALDNNGRVDIELGVDPSFKAEYRPDFLGGVVVINGKAADGTLLTALPFSVFANRENSTQTVWLRQHGVIPTTEWWCGKLYRPLKAERFIKN